jgi:hypothetical protein
MGEVKREMAVWIDFENAPHVLVLSPIIEHLQGEGYPLILTARDFSFTVGLCRRMGYDANVVGMPGPGKNTLAKTYRVLHRASLLYARLFKYRRKTALALSHGSRSQILAAHYLGIPVVSLDDYEFSNQSIVRFVDHLLVPSPIPAEAWGRYAEKVTHYPGLKEELYLCNFAPENDGLARLKTTDRIKVFFRPEGRLAHYHSSRGEFLQDAILEYLAGHDDLFLVLLPRDSEQEDALIDFCREHEVSWWIPERVISGPTLVREADMVISGGGTMTREASVLGIPSYSFFAGKWGAVDRHLKAQGRLVQISRIEDVNKIKVEKCNRPPLNVPDDALDSVVDFIENMLT